jgi:hypothetical protein
MAKGVGMIAASLIRLLKIVALLGFLLPWFAVSCSDKRLIEPRGYEIALGFEVQAHEDFTSQARAPSVAQVIPVRAQAQESGDGAQAGAGSQPRGWKPPAIVQAMAAGAALLLVIGFGVGFFLRGPAFAGVSAGCAFAAAGLAYATVASIEIELRRQIAEGTQGADNPFGGLALSLFQVSYEPGVWVTVGGAGAAGLIATFLLLLGLQKSTAAMGPSPPP